MDEGRQDPFPEPGDDAFPEDGTARYRAGNAPIAPVAAAGALVLADVVVLLGVCVLFSTLKNGWLGIHAVLSWHVWSAMAVALTASYLGGLFQIAGLAAGVLLAFQVAVAAASAAAALAVLVYLTAGWQDNLGPLGRIALSESFAAFALWQWGSRALAVHLREGRQQQLRWLCLRSPGGPSAPALARLLANDSFRSVTLLEPDAPAGAAWNDCPGMLAAAWSGVILAHDAPLPPIVLDALVRARLGGARVLDLTTLLERLEGRVPLERLRPQWFLDGDGFGITHSRTSLRLQRLLDIIASLVLLVAASPVLLLAALLVPLTSRGGVLYRQERVGRRGRRFRILKLRTMRADAEAAGAQWAQARDPRVTPLGRVLRAMRIDELPQLWNILRGDMSFIGPRPERPEFTAALEREIPFYALRHLVKPGLTGWAQVRFPYGASQEDAGRKLEYDLYYIKHHSLVLDVSILVRTVRVVLGRRGAR